jgi:SagB-type dehydrogenase family enzyme
MTDGIGQAFMEQTQYKYLRPSDQSKRLPQPPLELAYNKARPVIDLPAPASLPDYPLDLRTAIENRRSVREYAPRPLSLEELSFLLWCTQGVKETVDTYATLRTVPSAGARHAFETYLLVNDVEALSSGLYRFLALEHKLVEEKREAGLADKLTAACLDQPYVKRSAVTFFWVAVVYRMAWRYGQRGYRYLHLDAGHVCQNLYLAAQAVGAGVCAIAAFQDQELNDLLGLDGEEQFVVYLATVGKK